MKISPIMQEFYARDLKEYEACVAGRARLSEDQPDPQKLSPRRVARAAARRRARRLPKAALKKVLASAAAVALCCCLAVPQAYSADKSDEVASLQQQLNSIKNQIASLGDSIDNADTLKGALEQQKQIVQQQVDAIVDDVTAAQAAVVAKQQEVDAKQKEVTVAQAAVEVKKQEIESDGVLLAERLRAMQISHTSGILSTILNISSIDQLLSSGTVLSRIAEADTETLKTASEQKADLEAQQTALESEQQALQTEQTALQQTLTDLNTQQTLLTDKQTELSASIQAQDSAISSAEADKQAKESEYQKIYAEYSAAVAETNAWLAANHSSGTYSGDGLMCPLAGQSYYLSSGYGWRDDPWGTGAVYFHNGYDLAAAWGTPIKAAAAGTIIKTYYGTTGYGIYVVVDHGGGLTTLYGHCSALYVSTGETVAKGQVIAAVGSTGNSTGPHCHFTVMQNGVDQNPGNYLGW